MEASYIFTTPRLGLRRWMAADLGPFALMGRDKEVMRFFPQLMTPEDSAALIVRIEAHFDEYGYGLYAVDLLATGSFVGFVGFSHPAFECWFTPCVEIGWRLRREAWGKGYATEGALGCLRYGWDKLGLKRLFSFTAVVNTPSERVMQKIGMTKAGEFDHPGIGKEDWLRRHVLYVVDNK